MRTFIDTNVFLYAAGGAHPQREGCARVLRRVAEGTLAAMERRLRNEPSLPAILGC